MTTPDSRLHSERVAKTTKPAFCQNLLQLGRQAPQVRFPGAFGGQNRHFIEISHDIDPLRGVLAKRIQGMRVILAC